MDDLEKFKILFKLKSTYRYNNVEERKESVAEHSWACLVLADFFLPQLGMKIDRLRVYELLIYHDVVEIESGDTPLHPDYDDTNKKQNEREAMMVLKNKLPAHIGGRFESLFTEYENRSSLEAKFAKAIDSLEVELFLMNSNKDWKGYTKDFIINKKIGHFEEFPLMKKCFLEIIDEVERKGFFNQ